jgi:hypothetical protein
VPSERVSVTRYWLEKVLASLQGPLPSGHIGDVAFLLRDQVKDILDTAPTPPSSAPDAWRHRHSSWRKWEYTDDKPDGPSIHLFEVQALYAHPQPAGAEREALARWLRETAGQLILGNVEDGSVEVAKLVAAADALEAPSLSPVRSGRVIFPEDDWPERDQELADWFNAQRLDEAAWDAFMAILNARAALKGGNHE